VGERFFAPVQTGPGAHPAFYTMGTVSFLGLKSGRGVTLTPHPLLVPWSRKGRAIPLLLLWAIRPVQSLGACTRVCFTVFYIYHVRLAARTDFSTLFTVHACLPHNVTAMYLETSSTLLVTEVPENHCHLFLASLKYKLHACKLYNGREIFDCYSDFPYCTVKS